MTATSPPTPNRAAPVGLWVAGLLALAFGLVTIAEGGKVALGVGEAREAAGRYVPFVVWFNFCAGFAYVGCGVAMLLSRRQALPVARGLALATLLVFAALGIHIALGGAYETRTVVAMTIRSSIWAALAITVQRFHRAGLLR